MTYIDHQQHASAIAGDHRLDGRAALITGGAGGIGMAVARRLAGAGARIALADIDADRTDAAVAALRAEGFEASGLQADVSDPGAVAAMTEAAGAVDILVNNAGFMGRQAPLWELTKEDWDRVLAVDLTSVFLVTRAVLPQMRARRRGAVVSIASIAGKEGTPQLVPYSTAKAGIIAFTKALGKELVLEGVRVNCVAPGVVETPLLDQLTPDAVEVMRSKSPMGRLGTAEEVAAVVHFLASDAASFVTAQCYDVSGGRATY
jgi:3-oxoacyl-[acyl-carrier protein] reductase